MSRCLVAILIAGCSHAQRSNAPSTGTTTVEKGALAAEQEHSYTIRARAGETLTLSLSPQDGRVIISDILDPHRRSAIPADADERFWFGWTVNVNETGDFQVIVATTETAASSNPYTLTMTLR